MEECGIITQNRGKTFVKGAGYVRTYYVPLDEDYNLIYKENSSTYYRSIEKNNYPSLSSSGTNTPTYKTANFFDAVNLYDKKHLNISSNEDGFQEQSFTIRDHSLDDSSITSSESTDYENVDTHF